jgi:RNA polymerase sigma-70 factor, ECF subfamily
MAECAISPCDDTGSDSVPNTQGDQLRLQGIVHDNHAFTWRLLRRLGVRPDRLQDAVQQVFLVTVKRIADIEPGLERSWIIGASMRVAAEARRETGRFLLEDECGVQPRVDPSPGPDELADRKQARALLDHVLNAMPADLRVVFVLFELEEMTSLEIARLLELAPGTVASRLRRARESFHNGVKRLGLRPPNAGGIP